jgi:hypothetical protein
MAFILPLGIGPALLLANLTLQFHQPIPLIPQISIQTFPSNCSFPLEFRHQNEQQIITLKEDGPIKGFSFIFVSFTFFWNPRFLQWPGTTTSF